MSQNDCAPQPGSQYHYKRFYLNCNDPEALSRDLADHLFRPNAETPNETIIAFERKRLQRVMQKYGVQFSPELFGFDWDKLTKAVSKLRGMAYNHLQVVMPDLYDGKDMDEFVEFTTLPPDMHVPEDLDVFVTSMTSMRFVKERPEWVTRYGLLNQRKMGQTVKEPHKQDATRTGFWMLPPEALRLGIEANEKEMKRALQIFSQMQLPQGHDATFHMPIHGIYRENPNYEALRGWSDLLYDVPPEIQYPNGSAIPNYEMLAVRTHRKAYQRALEANPKIDDVIIDAFVQFEKCIRKVADGIPDERDREHFTKLMMNLYKTPFFHVIDPDTNDSRVEELRQKYPYITKNNKLMRALHATDLVHTTRGSIPAQEVVDDWRDRVVPYAQEKGILDPPGAKEAEKDV